MKIQDPEERAEAYKKLLSQHRVGVKDAARILNLHYVTISDYIAQGKMQAIKINNRFYISSKEIHRFIEYGPRPKSSSQEHGD